jgi:uncharacterized protein YjbI with pentapeptide repeats
VNKSGQNRKEILSPKNEKSRKNSKNNEKIGQQFRGVDVVKSRCNGGQCCKSSANEWVDILGVDISSVNILGVDLSSVDILGVDLSSVDILGVDLSSVDVLR